MSDTSLRDEINKRLTLNWLIQGAAQHAGMTLHHLVRDDLNARDPRLLHLYDQYALINLLQYWHIDAIVLMGRPRRFWKRAATKSSHPFFHHPLLSRYGGMLAEAGRQRALERSREKGVTRLPVVFGLQAAALIMRINLIERHHLATLSEIARRAASMAWGIPIDRLDGFVTPLVADQYAFERLPAARNLRGSVLKLAVCGYGGVVRRNGTLMVVGRGTNWQLVAKELVKGTAELICLHGLNRLDDQTYSEVTCAADGLEKEPAMLQTGGELWRRLLIVVPPDRAIAEVLMHLARLPEALESLIEAVIENPDRARELLAKASPAGSA
jgi:hypothetical protein